MLIVFEGMDGVGKSTIAKRVANDLNIEYKGKKIVDDLNININNYINFISEIRNSDIKEVSFFYYVFKCLYDKISSKDLITERGMASLYYFEKNNVNKECFDRVMKYNIIPDLTIVLYAGVEERLKRIKNRDINDPDLISQEVKNNGYDDMIYFLNKYNMPYILIDTENKTIDDIILEIEKEIINKLSLEYCRDVITYQPLDSSYETKDYCRVRKYE